MLEIKTFHEFLEIDKMGKTFESKKSYFPVLFGFSLDRIIVQAPIIPNFKVLGMANLQ